MQEIRYVHTNLIARDWKALAAFYAKAFSCEPVPPERHLSGEWIERMTGIAGVRIDGAHLRLPGCEGPTLEIFSYTPENTEGGAPEIDRDGFGHIAFHVTDVHAALDRVIKCGGSALGAVIEKDYPELGRLTAAYARDPEGNIVEIQHWHRP